MSKFLGLIVFLSIGLITNELKSLTYDEQFKRDWRCGKSKRWCQRVDGCVKKCKGCRAPYVIGDKYYCTRKDYCKVGEQCRGNQCQGIQYGQFYTYYPRDIDPCLNHN